MTVIGIQSGTKGKYQGNENPMHHSLALGLQQDKTRLDLDKSPAPGSTVTDLEPGVHTAFISVTAQQYLNMGGTWRGVAKDLCLIHSFSLSFLLPTISDPLLGTEDRQGLDSSYFQGIQNVTGKRYYRQVIMIPG